MTTIVWFRDDLRLSDNPALHWAASQGPVVPVYIYDDSNDDESRGRPPGAAQRWWLLQSLTALDASLRAHGGNLIVRAGKPEDVLADLLRETGATKVAWNRIYAEPHMTADAALKTTLQTNGLEVRSFNANLIHEPGQVKNKTGGQFKVFTPFWKSISVEHVHDALPVPPQMQFAPSTTTASLDALPLAPQPVDWAASWGDLHQPGEAGAHRLLESRFEPIFSNYGDDRNVPGVEGTSRLSPHLRFGEISPRQVWHKTIAALNQHGSNSKAERNAWAFLREIGWREFSHYLLYHFPQLPTKSWRPEFEDFPWADQPDLVEAWKRGQTGYPIVDAGMRELWHTGWMHNRVRMIVASFLIKHMLVDWRVGEQWFWDTLVDGCPANNPASWQWVAGSGADASPYFRIFNPITQAEKFDPQGTYVRRWVPELARLDDKLVHQPWDAPVLVLHAAGIRLGQNYPERIVDHKQARETALSAFETIKKKAA